MWTLIFGLLSQIPGLAGKFLDYQVQKANITLDGFKVGAQIDNEAYKAYLGAIVETNRMKLAANTWWGAKMIIMMAGAPAALHMGATFLDSMPFPYIGWDEWFFAFRTHLVGTWKVADLPKPYDQYQRDIVLSFFIVAPVLPVASAVSQWLARK